MKHKKNNRNASYDVNFMQTIIDGLYERNQELEEEVERLRTEIAETNDVNIQQDENYRNLVRLNIIIMVLQNLVIAHCDNSPLGKAVSLAIKRYQTTMAKSLVKGTVYIKEEDKKDWESEDDDDLI